MFFNYSFWDLLAFEKLGKYLNLLNEFKNNRMAYIYKITIGLKYNL